MPQDTPQGWGLASGAAATGPARTAGDVLGLRQLLDVVLVGVVEVDGDHGALDEGAVLGEAILMAADSRRYRTCPRSDFMTVRQFQRCRCLMAAWPPFPQMLARRKE
jgi:hypothetical protein